MAKVYAYMADGFEEVECLAVVDILRRGGVTVETMSVVKNPLVTGSHDIMVATDGIGGSIPEDADMVFLPGGKKGTDNLNTNVDFCNELKAAARRGVKLAAICAAPSILGRLGLLAGKRATCYPGFEDQLLEAKVCEDGVVTDGNVTTGRGMGFSVDMGLELLKILTSQENADRVKCAIQHPDTL